MGRKFAPSRDAPVLVREIKKGKVEDDGTGRNGKEDLDKGQV